MIRRLLFRRESACLQPLRELIEQQSHRTLVMWALEYAERVLPIFDAKYPTDNRPRDAVTAAAAWARGEIKMPIAKKAAHATHNAATAIAADPAACAAARAMGHVVGTVHVETHAIGVVIYGLTALVYQDGSGSSDALVACEIKWLYDHLLDWQAKIDTVEMPWAAFLLKDDVPNKELQLRQKMLSP